jgi:hypothetical protein
MCWKRTSVVTLERLRCSGCSPNNIQTRNMASRDGQTCSWQGTDRKADACTSRQPPARITFHEAFSKMAPPQQSGAELGSLVDQESARVACLKRSNWPSVRKLSADRVPMSCSSESSWGRRAEDSAGCTKQQVQQLTRCCNAPGHVTPTGAALALVQSCCSERCSSGCSRRRRERRLLSATAPLYTRSRREAGRRRGLDALDGVCVVERRAWEHVRTARRLASWPQNPGPGTHGLRSRSRRAAATRQLNRVRRTLTRRRVCATRAALVSIPDAVVDGVVRWL